MDHASTLRPSDAGLTSFPPVERRDRLVFVAMALAAAITWFPTGAIAIALPTLQETFDASLTELAWLPTIYMLVFAATLPLVGGITDRVGQRTLLIVGSGLFAAASLGAAAAPSYALLVVALLALGVGGVCLNVTSLAVLDVTYVGPARDQAIGLWAAATGLGQALGVPIGGLLIGSGLGWPAIFWLLAPGAALIMAIGVTVLQETGRRSTAPLDVVGAVALGAALVALVVLSVQGPTWGWVSPHSAALVAIAAVLIGVLTISLRRADDPVVPEVVLRNPQFVGGIILIGAMSLPLTGALFLLPLLLENALGESTLRAGWVLLSVGGPLVAAAALGGWVSRAIGARLAAMIGCAACGAGAVLIALVDADASAVELLPGLAILGAGSGLITAVGAATSMGAVPTTFAASASALLSAVAFLGGAMGVAVSAGLFDAFAGAAAGVPGRSADVNVIADGVSGTFYVLAAVVTAAALVAMTTFPGGRSNSTR